LIYALYKANIILYLRLKTPKAAILYLLLVLLVQISSLNLKATTISSGTLRQSQSIVTGEMLVSPSGYIKLFVTYDGNLVLLWM
jgi:hypothetical protein